MSKRLDELNALCATVLVGGLPDGLKEIIRDAIGRGWRKKEILAAVRASVKRQTRWEAGRLTLLAVEAFIDKVKAGS